MLIILFKTKEEKCYLFKGEKLANFQNTKKKTFKQMTN